VTEGSETVRVPVKVRRKAGPSCKANCQSLLSPIADLPFDDDGAR
jgi:hypothetical protein